MKRAKAVTVSKAPLKVSLQPRGDAFGTPGATPIPGNLTPKHYAQGHAGRRESNAIQLPVKREVRSFGD